MPSGYFQTLSVAVMRTASCLCGPRPWLLNIAVAQSLRCVTYGAIFMSFHYLSFICRSPKGENTAEERGQAGVWMWVPELWIQICPNAGVDKYSTCSTNHSPLAAFKRLLRRSH